MNANQPTIICPEGRLDAARAPALEQELRDFFAEGHNNLIVDLGQASYISSNGLRILLAGLKSAKQAGGMLRLCCLGPRLVEIFEMIGFNQVFEIYTDRQAAIRAFGEARVE